MVCSGGLQNELQAQRGLRDIVNRIPVLAVCDLGGLGIVDSESAVMRIFNNFHHKHTDTVAITVYNVFRRNRRCDLMTFSSCPCAGGNDASV